MDIFPLAVRMRPKNLEEFIGQEHLVSKGKVVRQMVDSGKIFPMIFWGPPGTSQDESENNSFHR